MQTRITDTRTGKLRQATVSDRYGTLCIEERGKKSNVSHKEFERVKREYYKQKFKFLRSCG